MKLIHRYTLRQLLVEKINFQKPIETPTEEWKKYFDEKFKDSEAFPSSMQEDWLAAREMVDEAIALMDEEKENLNKHWKATYKKEEQKEEKIEDKIEQLEDKVEPEVPETSKISYEDARDKLEKNRNAYSDEIMRLTTWASGDFVNRGWLYGALSPATELTVSFMKSYGTAVKSEHFRKDRENYAEFMNDAADAYEVIASGLVEMIKSSAVEAAVRKAYNTVLEKYSITKI